MKVVYSQFGHFRLSKFGAEAYGKITGLKVGYHDCGEYTYNDCDICDFCIDRSDETLIHLVQSFGHLMDSSGIFGSFLRIEEIPDGTRYDICVISPDYGDEYIERYE